MSIIEKTVYIYKCDNGCGSVLGEAREGDGCSCGEFPPDPVTYNRHEPFAARVYPLTDIATKAPRTSFILRFCSQECEDEWKGQHRR